MVDKILNPSDHHSNEYVSNATHAATVYIGVYEYNPGLKEIYTMVTENKMLKSPQKFLSTVEPLF